MRSRAAISIFHSAPFAARSASLSLLRLQPLHSRHEVGLRRADRQVVVIAHHDVGRRLPPAPGHRFPQRLLKGTCGAVAGKHVPAIVSDVAYAR